MKFKDKIKVVGLTGLAAACLSGCGPLNWADVYDATSRAAADRQAGSGNIDAARGLGAVSDLSALASQRYYDTQRQEAEAKAMKKAAEAGATRVVQNVNVNGNGNTESSYPDVCTSKTNPLNLRAGEIYDVTCRNNKYDQTSVNKDFMFVGFGTDKKTGERYYAFSKITYGITNGRAYPLMDDAQYFLEDTVSSAVMK